MGNEEKWPLKRHEKLGLVALVIASLYGCGVWANGPDPERDREAARIACEDRVKDGLKAPSSANFQRPIITDTGENKWRIKGEFDAQNGFGAMIRSTYVCETRLEGEYFKTKIVSVD